MEAAGVEPAVGSLADRRVRARTNHRQLASPYGMLSLTAKVSSTSTSLPKVGGLRAAPRPTQARNRTVNDVGSAILKVLYSCRKLSSPYGPVYFFTVARFLAAGFGSFVTDTFPTGISMGTPLSSRMLAWMASSASTSCLSNSAPASGSISSNA